MKYKKNQNSRDVSDSKWKRRRKRDDTPTFIKNANARAEMLNPARNRVSDIPVLTVPSSIRLWQKIRWPLFICITAILLVTAAIITNNYLVSQSVEFRVADAFTKESLATVESFKKNNESLLELSLDNLDDNRAQAAFVWHGVLSERMFGQKKPFPSEYQAAKKLILEEQTSAALAALAGDAFLNGEIEKATEYVKVGLKHHPDSVRIKLVQSWIFREKGEHSDSSFVLMAIRKSNPEYLPALFILLRDAIEDNDEKSVEVLSSRFLSIAPGNLLAALGSVASRLPNWNSPKISNGAISSLERELGALSEKIAQAPGSLNIYGELLKGRVFLLAKRYVEAEQAFKKVLSVKPTVDLVGYYAETVKNLKGTSAALQITEKYPSFSNDMLNSYKASWYLENHQIQKTGVALSQIKSQQADQGTLADIRWGYSVRAGDLITAKKLLPKSLDKSLWWLGLELYALLRNVGDASGVDALISAFGSQSLVGQTMTLWKSEDLKTAKKFITNPENLKDPYFAALFVILMRNAAPVTDLQTAVSSFVGQKNKSINLAILEALVVWRTDGFVAAKNLLKTLVSKKPDGTPVQSAIAKAYIEIGAYQEAIGYLQNNADLEAQALTLLAHYHLKNMDQLNAGLEKMRQQKSVENSPVAMYCDVLNKLEQKEYNSVVSQVDSALERFETFGVWMSEISFIKAKALNALRLRGDADRSLLAAGKVARRTVGFDEEWEVKIATVELNFRRGGNFLLKAIGLMTEMIREKIKHAKLSYSYGVANFLQGNQRGCMRYFREALVMDPSMVLAYDYLNQIGRLTDEDRAVLGKLRPGIVLPSEVSAAKAGGKI